MTAPRRHVLLDPDDDSGELIRLAHPCFGRRRTPLFLAGVPGGEVRITNAWLPPSAIKLYRFATIRQAEAAAPQVMRHARLSDDGAAWVVDDVVRNPPRDIAGALAKLRAWARALEPEIRDALTGLGPGHYSMLERQEPVQ